ncbi:MAG TPA: Crp/Fnr family transcriptional regulator [Roseateles sp.]
MKHTLAAPAAEALLAAGVHAQAWQHDAADEGVLRGVGCAADWRFNRLLAALAPAHRERWMPQAESVYLRAGQMLHEAAAFMPWVYFPVTALVSLSMPDRTGGCTEVASVGREGVVGLPLIDGNYTRSRAIVHMPGKALRLRASVVAEEFARHATVRKLLLAYSQALVAEIMQTALCNRHHGLDQQLARLILLRLDRQPCETLFMTQESMAGMLGVRRESVTLAAARLQQAGHIRYARGHITVLARGGLEERACDCYRTIRCEFDRLLRPRPTY